MTTREQQPPQTTAARLPTNPPKGPKIMHDWHASFISAGQPSTAEDPAIYFRRDFDVEAVPIRASLKVTALGIVEPFLNGNRVGEEVLAPGWTSYRHHLYISTYDVTDLIETGANTFGAIVGEGWAAGALTWDHNRHNYSDRPVLFAQLELDFGDRVEYIGTDTSFQVGTGGVRGNGIYDGETYDARLEPAGWNRPGFDATDWAPANPFDWDINTLKEPIAPPIRRIEEVPVVQITQSASGRAIVDFGQVITGWVKLTVEGAAGNELTLRFAELLTPDGEIETETNRGAKATDRYILRGGGEPETWEPGFTFHGFRYVEVDGWPGELAPTSLVGVVVHTDMVRTGWFESSNQLLTQLHRNIVWSMRGNFVGVPTDCPQRDERLGWTGDLNAFSPTATYLYDVRGILQSWLRDLASEQEDEGTVPWVVPDVVRTPSSAAALWSDVAVSLPWTLYQEYGDLEILRTAYPSMTAFIREVEAALNPNGLWDSGFQFGDWLDPDAPGSRPFDGKANRYLIACAYLCKTTREMAETAVLLGQASDAEEFRALHERVVGAFRDEFVAPSGRLVSEAATSYALAIMFDILEPQQKQRAGDRLAELVEEAGFRISTGFAGTPVVTDALTVTGHLKEAYRLLLQTERPSFLYPVTMGATTMWERWDAVLPDGTVHATGMTSLNHYALGAIADWLHRVVGGLKREAPGWEHIRVAPQPGGGLTSVRTAHLTPRGRVAAQWEITGDEMEVSVTVPQGASATVVLPMHPDGETHRVGPGDHVWRYALPQGYGDRLELTLDSSMKDIIDDDQVWERVAGVLQRHYPSMPIASVSAHIGDIPLRAAIERLPYPTPTLQDELIQALRETPSAV